MRFDSSDAHQFESLSIRIGFSFSIIIKNIFDLHWTWLINKKTGFVPVFFVYYPRTLTGNRHTQNACVLNWVRIFDQDRCRLASVRSGENSSLASLPIKYNARLLILETKNRPLSPNIREAHYAHGKADFIAKLQIALKEANETGYWLELAYRTNYIDAQQYKILSDKCATLRVMLVSSCRTAKSNIDNK